MSKLVCIDVFFSRFVYRAFSKYQIRFITEKELCRVQARKSFNNGRYGNALDWALRSQDNLYVTAIADLFLRVCLFRTFIVIVRNSRMLSFLSTRILRITRKRVKYSAKTW